MDSWYQGNSRVLHGLSVILRATVLFVILAVGVSLPAIGHLGQHFSSHRLELSLLFAGLMIILPFGDYLVRQERTHHN